MNFKKKKLKKNFKKFFQEIYLKKYHVQLKDRNTFNQHENVLICLIEHSKKKEKKTL